MSQPVEIDERKYGEYLLECRASQTTPSLSDYHVWLSELDEDTDEPDQEEIEHA